VDALTIENVRKAFDDTEALRGVSFSLRAGECLALLGPNGAGKSTLVRAISERVKLDAGSIAIGVTSGDRASIGVVPQEIALYEKLTAKENLRVFGALHGITGKELVSRVVWALNWSGLESRANDLVETFSGGMQRRLNVVCGLMHQPRILVLDEPTVGVDPQSRNHLWRMLQELRKDETSILLTTHQLDEAQEVSDRIVIMDEGLVVAEGTFQELLQTTVGDQRRVACYVDRLPGDGIEIPGFAKSGDNCLIANIEDVARDLPARLAELHEHGLELVDMVIHQPSLQAVFLHLTGKELRE
jgi:ABC-2 type transport system ATP-binding protein